MKTLQEKIAVMQGAAEGKPIEFRKGGDGPWMSVDTQYVAWRWHDTDYRVKKEPRVFYGFEYTGPPEDVRVGRVYRVTPSKKEIDDLVHGNPFRRVVKLIEVLE